MLFYNNNGVTYVQHSCLNIETCCHKETGFDRGGPVPLHRRFSSLFFFRLIFYFLLLVSILLRFFSFFPSVVSCRSPSTPGGPARRPEERCSRRQVVAFVYRYDRQYLLYLGIRTRLYEYRVVLCVLDDVCRANNAAARTFRPYKLHNDVFFCCFSSIPQIFDRETVRGRVGNEQRFHEDAFNPYAPNDVENFRVTLLKNVVYFMFSETCCRV